MIKVNRVVRNTDSCIRLYSLENTAVADPGRGPRGPDGLDRPLYGTVRENNRTDRETPSLALWICEFHHNYF